jgi:hypothetical protein
MNFVRSIGYGIAAVLKWLSILLFTLSGSALVTLGVYDLVEFEPRRAEIDAMLSAGDPLDRFPPNLLPALQRADANGNVAPPAARAILIQVDCVDGRCGPNWQIRWLLWSGLVKMHLSESEQLLIVRPRVFFGKGVSGYAAGALSVYGRPLNQLSDYELAELVVIARWPTRYRNPESSAHVAKAASELLQQVRTAR